MEKLLLGVRFSRHTSRGCSFKCMHQSARPPSSRPQVGEVPHKLVHKPLLSLATSRDVPPPAHVSRQAGNCPH